MFLQKGNTEKLLKSQAFDLGRLESIQPKIFTEHLHCAPGSALVSGNTTVNKAKGFLLTEILPYREDTDSKRVIWYTDGVG